MMRMAWGRAMGKRNRAALTVLAVFAAAIAAVCSFGAAGGSAFADGRGPAAGAQADVARLVPYADAVLLPDERLWIVLARTPEGLFRWSGDSPAEAQRWIESQAAEFPEAGTMWFVNVQGLAAAADGPEALWADVADRAGGAEVIEAYADGNTYSRAFSAPGFAPLPGTDITLQAAAHLDTESGRWRLTLGTPVVMIEY